MIVLGPVDPQFAAVDLDCDPAPGQAPSDRGDHGRAGARSAGLGQAGAALPHAQADSVAGLDLGDADIGALREQAVMFQPGADFGDRHRFGIVDEKHGVRVAHADAGRIGERAFRNAEMQRVAVLRKRNILPVERRAAHIDRHAAVAVALAIEHAGDALERDFGLSGLLHQQRGGAAGAVAAGAGFRTVAVQEGEAVVRQAGGRWRDDDELVAADAPVAVGDPRCRPGAGRRRAVPQVQHHEVVAGSVHLHERKAGRPEGGRGRFGRGWSGRAHGRGDMVFPPRLSTRQSVCRIVRGDGYSAAAFAGLTGRRGASKSHPEFSAALPGALPRGPARLRRFAHGRVLHWAGRRKDSGHRAYMFDSLTSRLGDVFDKLTRRGALSESDVTAALREVRVALLEADVALPVVRDFIERVKERAVGAEVLKSVTPGQQVVKIVNDELIETLGRDVEEIDLRAQPPAVLMLVGLQGSGKTTTAAKIGKFLTGKERKRVLMASLDTRRPAAQEQLRVLGEQAQVATLPVVMGEPPAAIAGRALQTGKLEAWDVVILDTAGRLHIDQDLMDEVAAVGKATNPVETLLVADAMTGQDAVTIAKAFDEQVGITGIVLTRIDGDARGGAALSMRAVTGKPIKLMGTGEKLDGLEPFHPDRIASRILGMGDVVSLVEKAAETIEQEEAEKLAKKIQKGSLDLEDMLGQLRQLKKMGGLGSLMNLLPGVARAKKQMAAANVDEKAIGRQEAMILSMTVKERRAPQIIHASRKKRIAAGSGVTVQDVNKLLKQWQEMNKVMKRMKKMGKKGQLPDLSQLQDGGLPGDMQLPGLGGGALGGGGSGLPGGLANLPPGFGKRRIK